LPISDVLSRISPFVPLSKRLLLIVWPFLAIVIFLLLLALGAVDILSAGRAYVGGESLWSKAQKDAVYDLSRYAQTKEEGEYLKFRRAITVPLGDRMARIELDKRNPDIEVARTGLVEGRTHPDDLPGVIRLFRTMRDVSYMARVVELWEQGDGYVIELDRLGEAIHARIVTGNGSDANLRPLLTRLHQINERITPLSDEFSYTLGEANRALRSSLLVIIVVAVLVMVLVGIGLSGRMLRRSEAFERALRNSEERFKLAVSGTNDGVWDWNMLTDEVYYSPRFRQLLGFGPDETISSITELISRLHPEDQTHAQAVLQSHLKSGTPFDVELRLLTKAEIYKWFRARGQSVRRPDGKAIRLAGAIADITDKKLADAQLFAEKERAQVTLASIGDAVITTDSAGMVDYFNPVAEELTGWPSAQAKGQRIESVFKIIDETTREEAFDSFEMVLRTGRAVSMSSNLVLVRRDGTEILINKSDAPIRDRSGQVTGIVMIFHDVSREGQYAARLSYQASHDALTGLINRHEFEHRLSGALKSATRFRRNHSLLYLDLDQFKVVNDTCGHAAGDDLMRRIGALLLGHLREGAVLARLGGDEFGVLLEDCPLERATRIAEDLLQTIKDFRFSWMAMPLTVGASIGVVCIAEGGFTLEEVLRAADAACYMAKEKGRNRVNVYRADDSEVSSRQGEMEWVARIQRALDEERFRLFSQQIVSLQQSSKHGTHCEILLRMLDERGNLVLPARFIPAAEKYGLMPALDRWVVTKAFETYARQVTQSRAAPIQTCSINLSGKSIGDDSFLDFLRTQAAIAGVPYNAFCFEITETAAVENLPKAVHFIEQLRALGCRFSLDDFGAGMSSFAYLKHLPVDYLKIDGGFVKDMLDDPIDKAMVEAINDIGHVMGKKTIAEFVENTEIVDALREMGVDYAQGFGVSKPVPFGPGGVTRLSLANSLSNAEASRDASPESKLKK
jgi:diguanylate cyclase (GGDEF)-like protein/PAS domain S-box-containing protein